MENCKLLTIAKDRILRGLSDDLDSKQLSQKKIANELHVRKHP
jgi:predicted XRE-type DNA-binding protein